ncbi:MAG TPA: DUF554 domain-containing protein [Tenuifilaceae bacterium]|nr:DUF554 domain-containing protein [Tenuifilaceae bacterium]
MWGTLINALAIIVGSVLGLTLRARLPEKYVKAFFSVIGLFTLVLGFSMAIKTAKPLHLIFSLIVGVVVGTWLKLEQRLNGLSDYLKVKFNFSDQRFSEGIIVPFLMFCMGSLTVLGALEEGAGGEPKLFYVKSLMDGFSSIALASALGVGVLFSVIPLLIYQGGLTYLAAIFSQSLSDTMVVELSATGGVMLIALGLNILEIKKIEVVNLIPALLFNLLFVYLF